MYIMARTSKPKAPRAKGTLGQRIARLRKERGYTQAELAEKMDTIQRLISDYERDKLRPHPAMIVRFASALQVTADELLGIKASKKDGTVPKLRITQRLKKIEELPLSQQKFILKTVDSLIKAAEK